MKKIIANIEEEHFDAIEGFLSMMRDPMTDKPVTLQSLMETLLEDVAIASTRNGSWEASNMLRVLQGHGYFNWP